MAESAGFDSDPDNPDNRFIRTKSYKNGAKHNHQNIPDIMGTNLFLRLIRKKLYEPKCPDKAESTVHSFQNFASILRQYGTICL